MTSTLSTGLTSQADSILTTLAPVDRLSIRDIRLRSGADTWPTGRLARTLDALRERGLIERVDLDTYALSIAGRREVTKPSPDWLSEHDGRWIAGPDGHEWPVPEVSFESAGEASAWAVANGLPLIGRVVVATPEKVIDGDDIIELISARTFDWAGDSELIDPGQGDSEALADAVHRVLREREILHKVFVVRDVQRADDSPEAADA